MMLQNAGAQTAADYFNNGTPISAIYDLFTPAELNAGGYSYSDIIGASPGDDFAAIKAAGATAPDFYNEATPVFAVYAIYTPTELYAAGAGYSYSEIIGASPGDDFAAIKAAGATAPDFYNEATPVFAVYAIYTPTELYAAGAGYSYSEIIGASPGGDFAAIKAAGATAPDFYNALTPVSAVYAIYTPTELYAAGAGYSYSEIIGASPGGDFAAIKAAGATAPDFYNAATPVSAVYAIYTPTELYAAGSGYSYSDIIGASPGTDFAAIQAAGATASDFYNEGITIRALYSLYTMPELSAAGYTNNDLLVGLNSSGVTTNFTSGINSFDNTYVGFTATDSNNTLNVLNPGTLLTNSGDVYLGYEGSSNSMVISSGGTVVDANGYIGFTNTSSNNNVLVTGANSLWTNGGALQVGSQGSGNSLVIADGGTVANTDGNIGIASSASSNSVLVTGANSLWTNSSDLIVGNRGSSNRLVISNGGVVANRQGYIGFTNTASNNSVLVTGAGSLWTNSNGFNVGFISAGNTLTVADGGSVSAGSAGSVYVGNGAAGNSLIISNGGTVLNRDGYVGGTTNASSNSVLVTGTGSLWTNSGFFVVGRGSASNSLSISDGGTVRNVAGRIGERSTASNNSVLVTGAGSLWTNSSDLHVGYDGSGNSLLITDGGTVVNAAGYIGGYLNGTNPDSGLESTASNNSVLVTGAGSLWTNSGDLHVGYDGSYNSLVISNAGQVANANVYVGYASNSAGNNVLVTGTNSLWTNSGILFVGDRGAGNSLAISDGGRVISDLFLVLGNFSSASNNSVLVTGTNSIWLSDALVVGGDGSGNSLVISNGGGVGLVAAQTGGLGGIIGSAAESTGNSVLVTGTSGLETLGALAVGAGGSSNSLVISNGGTVLSAGESIIGVESTASNNSVLVTGAGSLWTNSGDLYVGLEGSGNSLVISNGGMVQNNAGVIGEDTNALNNSVLVTGAASTWTNSGALTIAQRGSGTLTVVSGGSVASSGITIASSNTATGTLNIGHFGTNDTGGTIIAPTIAFGAGTGVINFNQSDAVTITSAISGAGTINQLGGGTTVLSGGSANTYSGTTTVSGGTLNLNKTAGVDAVAGAVVVNSGAILLLSSSGNVKDTAAVTLSGGTITRGSGVSETFGALNITGSGILDFGTGATGNLTFGTYQSNVATPSALLTLNNFIPGNAFTFASTSFSTNNLGNYFTFGTGYVNSSITDNGSESFTITAIPEPSTYVAAIALLALMLWPLCRRWHGKVS